jgi:protein involved in polysaccharide export with SLBB domain
MLGVGTIGACNKSDEANNSPPPTSQATSPSPAVTVKPAPVAPTSAPTAYLATTQPGRILVGDLLGVEVWGLTRPASTVLLPKQVAADGTISVPYTSKPLMVAGLTDAAAEQVIVDHFHEENIIQRAEVGVRRLRVAGTGGPLPGLIAPYDLVRIDIANLLGPDSMTVRVERVGGDGMLEFPFIGTRKIGGLTGPQAEALIVKTYNVENIIQKALVNVLRLEAAPANAGAVDLPDVPIYPIPDVLRWLYEPGEIPPKPPS